MRTMLTAILGCTFLIAGPARAADELMTAAQELFEPIPDKAPALEGNPGTPAKVELGGMLFFEPRL